MLIACHFESSCSASSGMLFHPPNRRGERLVGPNFETEMAKNLIKKYASVFSILILQGVNHPLIPNPFPPQYC